MLSEGGEKKSAPNCFLLFVRCIFFTFNNCFGYCSCDGEKKNFLALSIIVFLLSCVRYIICGSSHARSSDEMGGTRSILGEDREK